jgi:hypothetical protein
MTIVHRNGLFADLIRRLRRPPQGAAGIAALGHRRYVGGSWEEIGELQFRFLLEHGLQRESVLLDIACGSLRLGSRVIPFLAPGHYLGIEKEAALVQAGLEHEVGADLERLQQPRIVVNSEFAFEQLDRKADIAIAQSLFTHLPPEPIGLCFRKLRPWLQPQGVFYATFFPSRSKRRHSLTAHDHGYFAYTDSEIRAFGEANGYRCDLLGDWGHPRGQVMAAYHPQP